MALSDPQSVTINSVAKSLARIETSGRQSVYMTSDGAFTLKVSHQSKSGRIRSLVRLDQVKDATDPYTAETVQSRASVWLVIDRPSSAFYTATEVDYIVQGMAGYLDTAKDTQIIGQES